MPMTRALHKHLGISADTLLQPVGQEFDAESLSKPSQDFWNIVRRYLST